MKCLVIPGWPNPGGLVRDAALAELVPKPGDAPVLPEDALAPMRLAFGTFKANACTRAECQAATALALTIQRGNTTYAELEKTCAEARGQLEALKVRHVAYSSHRHGGVATIEQRRSPVTTEVNVIVELAHPVDFGTCSPLEFIESARDAARELGLAGALVGVPWFPLRPPHGSHAMPLYITRPSGPRLDLAAMIRERQRASRRVELEAKLGELEAAEKSLATQIAETRAALEANQEAR